ncbi:MAG: hypothetical protein AAGL17_02145, partial [Cyanobacteria bacterium J06576_12]
MRTTSMTDLEALALAAKARLRKEQERANVTARQGQSAQGFSSEEIQGMIDELERPSRQQIDRMLAELKGQSSATGTDAKRKKLRLQQDQVRARANSSTYEELIAKARELDAAGDTAGAKRLAQIAISRRDQAKAAQAANTMGQVFEIQADDSTVYKVFFQNLAPRFVVAAHSIHSRSGLFNAVGLDLI